MEVENTENNEGTHLAFVTDEDSVNTNEEEWPERSGTLRMREEHIEMVRHLYSEIQAVDEEVEYAKIIEDQLTRAEIQTDDEQNCEVTLYTNKAVYHFYRFRTHYEGHASRALGRLLDLFDVFLPIEFLVNHPNMVIYLTGTNDKIVSKQNGEEKEYQLEYRLGKTRIVEPITWLMASDTLDLLYAWAMETGVEGRPDLIVELLIDNERKRIGIGNEGETSTSETEENAV